MDLTYFEQKDGCYIWKEKYHTKEVKICFSSPSIEVWYGDSVICRLKCTCANFDEFQDLLFELDDFWENPPNVKETKDVPFLSHIFIRHLIHDAYQILEEQKLIHPRSECRKAEIYLSLALFNLILRKKILQSVKTENIYCLINFCRNKVIGEFDHAVEDHIRYVQLLCQYWIYTFKEYGKLFIAINKDPEKELWRILDEDYSECKPNWYSIRLWEFWYKRHKEDSRIRYEFLSMLKEITDWFSIKRYNLDAAASLFNIQRKVERKKEIEKASWLSRLIDRHWAIIVLILMFSSVLPGNYLTSVLFGNAFIFTAIFAGLIIWFLYYFVIKFICRKDIYWFRKMVPRLFVSIIIGYMPLMMASDMWEFGANARKTALFPISFFGIAVSILYMFIVVNKAIDDKREAWKRALKLICVGLAESLIIGFILCVLFGDMISKSNIVGTLFLGIPRRVNIPFLPLFVYPTVILMYFPLALFIGIFVQLFWEDKPVTEQL